MKPVQEVHVNPDNSILFVIDVEKKPTGGVAFTAQPPSILMPTGGVVQWPGAAERIVPVIRSLIDRCHANGVRVIYIQSVRNHTEHQFTVYSTFPRHLRIGTSASEFFDEIRPNGMDIVVRKWDHDPWFETDLERVLAGVVVDPTKCQALITGGSVVGCAFNAMLGFHARNYRLAMIADAVYGSPDVAATYFSRTRYPTYPNISVTRSDLIRFPSDHAALATPGLGAKAVSAAAQQ